MFELQRLNGKSEYLTKNEYGRGIAQVVLHKEDDLYDFIIDKNLVLTLVPEDGLEAMKETLGDEYEDFWDVRQKAIYTICHELSHIHEYMLNRSIPWLKGLDYKEDINSQYIRLALQIWSEYFACRTASFTLRNKIEDWTEIVKTSIDAEEMLQMKRSKYNRRLISLEEFVIEFHKYTSFLLKKIASAHGNLYSLIDGRETICQVMNEEFKDSYTSAIWIKMGDVLNKLYDKHPNWEDSGVVKGLIEIIKIYYSQFEIFIIETSDGVVYDIPVRL